MRVSAKVDYALRAAVELAAAPDGEPMKAEAIAAAQDIPRKFLDNILQSLRHAGIVESRRGPDGGHLLARPPSEITVADIMRTLEGPLANVGGRPPESVEFGGPAEALRDVWVALRVNLREVLEHVTLDEIARGELPEAVVALTRAPGAWHRR